MSNTKKLKIYIHTDKYLQECAKVTAAQWGLLSWLIRLYYMHGRKLPMYVKHKIIVTDYTGEDLDFVLNTYFPNGVLKAEWLYEQK